MKFWTLVIVGVLMSSLGGVFFKLGAVSSDFGGGTVKALVSVMTNWRIIVGGILYVLPAAIWIYLLRTAEISFLQPLFSLVYVVTPLLASFVLGEAVGGMRWAGIGIIMFGIFVVSRS